LALRTQQVLAHESGVANTVDPLAGSFLIEHLTDEIERRAQEYLDRIEAMGGALAAIERGYLQAEIHEAAYQAQRRIEARQALVVGVNAYQSDEPMRLERLRVDPAIEQRQRQRLAEVRSRRDPAAVGALLGRLASAAEGTENLIPVILACVEADVTLGEICGRLRSLWGEYRPTTAV
jgi:methylmalonyl-CoA mutase N-terminal domain/subunit